MQTDILIAGAGLSGLALATTLHEAGVSCLLMEARDRVGGRILTLEKTYDGGGVIHADIGPSWIWPGQERVASLLQKLGIGVFEQYSAGRLVYQDELGKVRRDLDYSTMAGSLRVDGGIARLTRELAARLPPGILQLSHPLTRVRQLDQGFEISIKNGDGQLELRARKVVLAIPPRVIVNQIEFEPALAAGVTAGMKSIPTWMAGHAKLFALYPRPFWRDTGLSGDGISRSGPLMEIHDASPANAKYGALFGFVGLPAGAPTRAATPLSQAAVVQLQKMFGAEAAEPLDVLLKDWAQDEYTATAADSATTSHPQYGTPPSLAALAQQGMVLASSEMAPQFGGFIEGALEAAENALRQL
jgi:monoamine oxidase